MSNTLKFRLFLATAAVAVLCTVAAWADPPSQVGRLSLVSGAVSFLSGNLDEWTPATLNYPMTAGDQLWTDTGARAEVHVFSAAIRLDSRTDFSFLSLDDETVQVRLSEGSLNVHVRNVDQGTTLEIDTPVATVSLPSAGSYRIDVQPGGQTTVTVRSGGAEVTAGGNFFDVRAGQSTVVSGVDSITFFVTSASPLDEWDTWCAGRDRREAQGASGSHVSLEMIGAEDLNENGTWSVMAGNGAAWAPLHVSAAWAPYRFGHWAWVEPWGWTWIDDMPWGFAPFHYGRWVFLNARWMWLPGASVARPVYAPALVVFIGGSGWSPAAGTGIGWFPLGPREAYIPPYQVTTSYVQRINVGHVANISQQTIERFNPSQAAYVNRSAARGVTFVSRDVFAQSRPVGDGVLSITATETTRAPLMGMTAAVVPQRESIAARPAGNRSPAPQPPPEVVTRQVYSRAAPSPVRVPFAQQQRALSANPGRPVAPATLSGMQRDQKTAPPPVRIVNTATLTRLKNPPVVKSAPQNPPAARVPATGGQQNPPAARVPATGAAQRPAVTPAVTRAPAGKQPAASTAAGPGASGAAALIELLKTRSLPGADQDLADARKVAGIRIDLNAVARQLAAARAALSTAERDLAGGNSAQALKEATAIQKQVEDQVSQLSAATQAAKQVPQKR